MCFWMVSLAAFISLSRSPFLEDSFRAALASCSFLLNYNLLFLISCYLAAISALSLFNSSSLFVISLYLLAILFFSNSNNFSSCPIFFPFSIYSYLSRVISVSLVANLPFSISSCFSSWVIFLFCASYCYLVFLSVFCVACFWLVEDSSLADRMTCSRSVMSRPSTSTTFLYIS